jgi:ABC-2 type transport system permease protein
VINLRRTFYQLRYTNLAYWRNPSSALFTFAFPLMFLVIFTSLLGRHTFMLNGHLTHQTTYYVAAMASYGLISACYVNLAMVMTFQRDTGILKRVQGTPMPPAAYLAARVLHALAVAGLLIVITAAFGRVFYQADMPTGLALMRFVAMFLVGALSFSALAFAVSSIIPNADAAPAVVNITIMPLLFLSGIFIPLGDHTPTWIVWVGKFFPVRHFAEGMQSGFLGTAFRWSDVAVVAIWGMLGLVVAARRFNVEPRV